MTSSDVILEPDHLKHVVAEYMKQGAFVFDVEAYGPDRGFAPRAPLSWLSMATEGQTHVIPFGHPIGSKVIDTYKEPRTDKNGTVKRFTMPIYDDPPTQMTPAQVFEILYPLFFNEDITKIAHGGVYDFTAIYKMYKQVVPGPYFDTIVGQWVCDENWLAYGLKPSATKLYKFLYDDENVGKCVEKYPFNKVAYYSYCDAKIPWLRYKKLVKLIKQENVQDIFDLEMDLFRVLIDMRLRGVMVDVKRLEEMKVELTVKRDVVETNLYRASGYEFNINSAQQKQDLLYLPKSEGGQGLKPWKKTDGGKKKAKKNMKLDHRDYSTDAEVLESYPNNLVASTLLEYQEVAKVLGTYVIGYLGDEENGKEGRIYDERIHADFVQYGADTGRFSCREPNLQNIPRPDTELGKLVRGAFISEPGRKLLVADYGQIELVILAHFLGQGMLYDGFWKGIDPHRMTAAGALGKDPDDVTPDERQLFGKTLNFAMGYGVGDRKVASMLNVSEAEAEHILTTLRRSMPEVEVYKNHVWKEARKQKPIPFTTTLMGRKRRIADMNNGVHWVRAAAERKLFNSKIQGSNADIIKTAMVLVHRRLPEDVHLLLTVHDELVLSAPDGKVEEASAILKNAMVGPEIQSLLTVPVKTEVKVVDRWSDAK